MEAANIALLKNGISFPPNRQEVQAVAEESTKRKADAELKEACNGFEALFVHKLLQVMRGASDKSEFISGGRGEEIFQDMLDENYAHLITRTGALGLSRIIYEHTKEYL